MAPSPAVFVGSEFVGSDLVGSDLVGSDLVGSDLVGSVCAGPVLAARASCSAQYAVTLSSPPAAVTSRCQDVESRALPLPSTWS
ncbi:pentapeptide repeat-containing protein [Streptomyces sp. AC550_RSS872]|uniref:pentapeptide repeat-containing protein n=1 Tax=Streptomyces sp. AC550_RSS872 TaxID=2823689 RepID=UPI0035ABF6FC